MPGAADCSPWINDEGWNTPEPLMNFSASGLRFRDSAPCEEGDNILITFQLHGQSVWHRATATVVRRTPAENGMGADIAIAFQDMEPQAVEALADFTLDRQLAELARLGISE